MHPLHGGFGSSRSLFIFSRFIFGRLFALQSTAEEDGYRLLSHDIVLLPGPTLFSAERAPRPRRAPNPKGEDRVLAWPDHGHSHLRNFEFSANNKSVSFDMVHLTQLVGAHLEALCNT